jgi:hypothetical protein
MVILILTLKKHENGVWITNLVNALTRLGQDADTFNVVSIETFFAACPNVSTLFGEKNNNNNNIITGIVNRVSDAADPSMFKITMAILTAAHKRGIRIYNGPEAYALCANKFCHHIVFDLAGVQSPYSRVLQNANTKTNPLDIILEQYTTTTVTTESNILQYPLLIKPNAGGFGAGIHYVENGQTHKITKDQLTTPDGIHLLQNYVTSADGFIYRVWFLDGRVQCGVKRRVDNTNDQHETIITGCTGNSACMRPSLSPDPQEPSFVAFFVPPKIQKDVKQIVLQLPDAQAGSVEFLYNQQGIPLYFDLNLLSTLPQTETSGDAKLVWGESYDPWKELAASIHETLLGD